MTELQRERAKRYAKAFQGSLRFGTREGHTRIHLAYIDGHLYRVACIKGVTADLLTTAFEFNRNPCKLCLRLLRKYGKNF